jgi:hypothetical protein
MKKNSRDLIRGRNEFKKGYKPGSNFVKDESSEEWCLLACYTVWLLKSYMMRVVICMQILHLLNVHMVSYVRQKKKKIYIYIYLNY